MATTRHHELVHRLESQECAGANAVVVYELRPPAPHGYGRDSPVEFGATLQEQGPLLRVADRRHQRALVEARPPCFSRECRRDLLRQTHLMPTVRTKRLPNKQTSITCVAVTWEAGLCVL